MSNLPISSKYRSRPHDPVDDEERNELSTMANDAYTDGKLDDEQYQWVLDRVFGATTLGELAPVVEILGKAPSHTQPAIVAQTGQRPPGELAEIKAPGNRGLVVLGVAGATVLVLVVLLALLIVIL